MEPTVLGFGVIWTRNHSSRNFLAYASQALTRIRGGRRHYGVKRTAIGARINDLTPE